MDQKLKHRLTGAIILVSLAVIFIPVILEGPDNEWTPLNHGIPEPPQLGYKVDMDKPRSVVVPVPVPVKPEQTAVRTPVYKPAAPARKKTGSPVPKPESAARAESATETLSGWYVQVGSFSQELNASGLSKRLKLSGYNARLQKTTTETGAAWRVIVGPGKSRAGAEKMRDKLANERQLKGIVINNPG